MTRYLKFLIDRETDGDSQFGRQENLGKMQTLQIQTGEGYFGPVGYGYGLTITPDFLGHKLVSHGGSIIVSTAHMALVPELKFSLVLRSERGWSIWLENMQPTGISPR